MRDLNHLSREEFLLEKISSLQANYNVAYRLKLDGGTLAPDQFAAEVEQERARIEETGALKQLVAGWLRGLDHLFLTEPPITN